MADFLPTRQGDLDAWESNFSPKLPTIASTLGIGAPLVTALVNSIIAHRLTYSNAVKGRNDSKALNEKNILQWKQTEVLVRQMVKLLKANPAFTEDIAKSLDIDAVSGNSNVQVDAKPVLVLLLQGGEIVIKFKKLGYDGVKIYSRRDGETEFTFLATDTASPYNDSRPNLIAGQPEKREYYAFFLDHDDATAMASDIVSITL